MICKQTNKIPSKATIIRSRIFKNSPIKNVSFPAQDLLKNGSEESASTSYIEASSQPAPNNKKKSNMMVRNYNNKKKKKPSF